MNISTSFIDLEQYKDSTDLLLAHFNLIELLR